MNSFENKALENLRCAINPVLYFPKNIFLYPWKECLFFDSDWIFHPDFLKTMKDLIAIEKSHVICMAQLDKLYDGEDTIYSRAFIDEQTSVGTYQSLCGENVEHGWIYDFGRFGLTSDLGEWCFYCERRNEIAVVAFRESGSLTKYFSVTEQFKANSIGRAISRRASYGFKILSEEDQAEIIREFTK